MRVLGAAGCLVGALTIVAPITPSSANAQTGKWVATVTQLKNGGGTAELTVEPRNDKQSRAKITFHNTKRDMSLAWEIVAGNCRDDGAPIAPQAAFTQVRTQLDGGGTATSNVPKLVSGNRYYVRVFDPQTAPTDATAFGCGDLAEKPA